MRLLISTAVAAALVVSLPACKQQAAGDEAAATEAAASLDALNGTFKVDLASLKFGGPPSEYVLKDGTWTCASCVPPLTTPADGQFHAVADRPYFDSMSVTVVDDRTVDIHRKKGGKDASTVNIQVSEDGKTLTSKFKDMTTPGKTVEGSSTATRAGPASAGAHAVSGQWMTDRIGDYSEEALDISFQIDGDTVTSTSQGQTYTATLGGPAVAIENDTGGTTVKVERAGAGIKETYMRGGKEVGIATITPSPDGQSISYSSTDPRDGTTTDFTANKS